MSLPEIAEDPKILEDLLQDAFDNLQRSKGQLRRQISTLQARNQELEDYVHMVAHDLKEPLVVMAFASNLVTNMPALSSEKLKEYLRQMELTGNEMKRIINSLLLFAEVSKVDAPVEPVHMEKVVASVQARLGHMIREQQARIVLPKMWPLAIGYEPWLERCGPTISAMPSNTEGDHHI